MIIRCGSLAQLTMYGCLKTKRSGSVCGFVLLLRFFFVTVTVVLHLKKK